ncbi:chloride channel protein [Aliamphritea spongicola]|uniref:chloride channel protein n=1 Tax=Aliamphritea spongicola TaxID=707589 RepID=UPI001FAF8DE4|nr:chloride channel protein [Aliamphritea spongicola]
MIQILADLYYRRMLKNIFSFEHFRHRLAHAEALPQLVLLGIFSGLVTGLLILAFRLVIELPLSEWLPGGDTENFEDLPRWMHFALPIIGSIVLAAIFYRLAPATRKVGIVHVMERLTYHQGHLPAKNMWLQFVSAAVAILSGHSVGREGPAAHLGAACSSLLGQVLHLPNNSLRLLVGCGVAAAISAAFNTPLAGVIFAMEVILLEYTVIGFTPVLVASVTAALLVQSVYGHDADFDIPALQIQSLNEIPLVILLGFVIALIAAGFMRLMLYSQKSAKWPMTYRLLLAGLLTGIAALFYPQVMGIGYDTISESLQGNFTLSLLIGMLVAKCLLTPVVLGLGIPGGLIGPTFYIGALTGAAFALLTAGMAGPEHSEVGLYAMLGMGAMMGAVLNAPLAALIALLELTANPNIIFPGMLAIVVASTTVRYVFKLPSIFLATLQNQGLDYRHEPLSQALSRIGVASMLQSTVQLSFNCNLTAAKHALQQESQWLLLSNKEPDSILLPADLETFISEHPEDAEHDIDLMEIPALRRDVAPLSIKASLKDALDKMNHDQLDALYVCHLNQQIAGIITRDQIEHLYTQKLHN